MITKYTEFNIICDDCQVTGSHNFQDWCHERDKDNISLMGTELYSTIGIRDLRKFAKRFGWILSQTENGKLDICPRCSTKPEHTKKY